MYRVHSRAAPLWVHVLFAAPYCIRPPGTLVLIVVFFVRTTHATNSDSLCFRAGEQWRLSLQGNRWVRRPAIYMTRVCQGPSLRPLPALVSVADSSSYCGLLVQAPLAPVYLYVISAGSLVVLPDKQHVSSRLCT